MNTTSTILICDDEIDLREMLQEYLQKRGYDVVLAFDAISMREAVDASAPDLILLDINMPGEDGLSALRNLRTENDVPVVMLTAAGETIDKIVGLEMGADDYLGKPVDLRELEARIKAVLRRRSAPVSQAVNRAPTQRVAMGDYTLDLESAKLTDAEGADVSLTAMEFRLLKLFAENKGRVLNRDQILEQAHDRSWDPFDRSIDIRISRLRRKIERNPQKPSIIRTVRGIGYIFDHE